MSQRSLAPIASAGSHYLQAETAHSARPASANTIPVATLRMDKRFLRARATGMSQSDGYICLQCHIK